MDTYTGLSLGQELGKIQSWLHSGLLQKPQAPMSRSNKTLTPSELELELVWAYFLGPITMDFNHSKELRNLLQSCGVEHADYFSLLMSEPIINPEF